MGFFCLFIWLVGWLIDWLVGFFKTWEMLIFKAHMTNKQTTYHSEWAVVSLWPYQASSLTHVSSEGFSPGWHLHLHFPRSEKSVGQLGCSCKAGTESSPHGMDSWATSSKGRKQLGRRQSHFQKAVFEWESSAYVTINQQEHNLVCLVRLCCSWNRHKLLNSSS